MRQFLFFGVIVAMGLQAPEGSATPQRNVVRTAQVIVMLPRADAPVPAAAEPSLTDVPPADQNPTPIARGTLPAAFQAHDLSRKWVAFEMGRSFSSGGAADAGVDPLARVGVADNGLAETGSGPPRPAIQVPSWMQTGLAFSAVSTRFKAGCAPTTYRPTGFLHSNTERRRQAYYDMMSGVACEYGIPVGLFDAMIIRESGYQAGIHSAKNAFGLTQLMPGTAAGLGVNRYDVQQNLRGGALYLRQQLDRFGQVHLALAAYNAGPGRVRGGMLPRIAETQDYVQNVLLNWRRLASLPDAGAARAPSLSPDRLTPIGRVVTISSY